MESNNNAQQNVQQNQVQPGQIPNDRIAIDIKAFGSKYTSKKEVYRFLNHDCGAYLAKYQTMTVWHMRDLMSGERLRIKESEVKTLTVPFFEGLKIEKFLEFAAGYPQVMKALPILERERLSLPRDYIANVIYTLVGDVFKVWIERIVNNRHDKRREE